jgi:hypothetical protein
MTTWIWIVGAIVLIAAAAVPIALRRRVPPADLGRARDALSRLEFALDRTGLDPKVREDAERWFLLAGGALSGRPDAADAARSLRCSRSGLELLGEPSGQ